MKKLTFCGGWGYENNAYIAKGWQDEPIWVNEGACCEFYVDTTLYIGTKEEITTFWKKLVKDKDILTKGVKPNFTKDDLYCIEICKEDQFGKHYPARCCVSRVADIICWGFYKSITPFEKMRADKQNLYIKWLQEHKAWEKAQKEVN